MTAPHLLIVGVGGLGVHLVREGLERGAQVDVLVRDGSTLEERLDPDTLDRLGEIVVGAAIDPDTVDAAMAGIDVVLSGVGANRRIARQLAKGVRRNGVQKLIWPAGATNVMEADGVTPAYLAYQDSWPIAAEVYEAHQACIDAIREQDINYTIFCPAKMDPVGKRSADVRSSVRINRVAGPFVSYEDAAWVMLEAALTTTYDRQLITAAT